eukprot:31368-Pelagococcus_subviridis.AAC.11
MRVRRSTQYSCTRTAVLYNCCTRTYGSADGGIFEGTEVSYFRKYECLTSKRKYTYTTHTLLLGYFLTSLRTFVVSIYNIRRYESTSYEGKSTTEGLVAVAAAGRRHVGHLPMHSLHHARRRPARIAHVVSGSHTGKLDLNHKVFTATTPGSAVDTTSATGGGQAHENLPPYIAIHIWKRIA